jgi:hypothetical protein
MHRSSIESLPRDMLREIFSRLSEADHAVVQSTSRTLREASRDYVGEPVAVTRRDELLHAIRECRNLTLRAQLAATDKLSEIHFTSYDNPVVYCTHPFEKLYEISCEYYIIPCVYDFTPEAFAPDATYAHTPWYGGHVVAKIQDAVLRYACEYNYQFACYLATGFHGETRFGYDIIQMIFWAHYASGEVAARVADMLDRTVAGRGMFRALEIFDPDHIATLIKMAKFYACIASGKCDKARVLFPGIDRMRKLHGVMNAERICILSHRALQSDNIDCIKLAVELFGTFFPSYYRKYMIECVKMRFPGHVDEVEALFESAKKI